MSLLANGQYKIFSVQFPGQDVDLIGGGPTNVIAGYHANNLTHNMVWNLKNVGTMGNQFTLANDAPSAHGAFAGVSGEIVPGAQLHGSPTPLTWTVVGTCAPGEYWVFAPAASDLSVASGLIWSLSSGADGTPITLEPFTNSMGAYHSLQARDGGVSPAFSFSQFN